MSFLNKREQRQHDREQAEIAEEIALATAAGKSETPWREFKSWLEKLGAARCQCGYATKWVQYMVGFAGRMALCDDCMNQGPRYQKRLARHDAERRRWWALDNATILLRRKRRARSWKAREQAQDDVFAAFKGRRTKAAFAALGLKFDESYLKGRIAS